MELKARECPHCHHQVSMTVCSKYFLRGTAYTVYCNHCNTELALVKEPVPFQWCVFAGFLSTVIPAEYFLYVQKLGLARSLSYAALIGVLGVGIVCMLVLKGIRFRIADI